MINNYKLEELTEVEIEELEEYAEKTIKNLSQIELEDLINEYNRRERINEE
ncbi:hypothetical protein [[Clostridium] dakarense]|uniref:hypothetical protein n=1 Tax=Faecalimicrobium dakarense TaxID=1301100 RepID=UPI0012B55F21|nr:hypothetical protein [[Clostridium] dakarense]